VVKRSEQRLREAGYLTIPARFNAFCPRSVQTLVTEDAIIAAVEREPLRSSRAIARELGLPQVFVLNVLYDDELHPYHCSQNQHQPGSSFSAGAETCFTREEVFSFHSSHLWSPANPLASLARGYKARFSSNVWFSMVVVVVLVGLYPLPRWRVLAKFFLQTVITRLLEDVLIAMWQGLCFQHDGVTPHHGENVREWLDAMYTGRWIGRGGPIAWPLQSPDLTALDSFLWGHLKWHVYAVAATKIS
jgi:hypothetical protein